MEKKKDFHLLEVKLKQTGKKTKQDHKYSTKKNPKNKINIFANFK